MSKAIKIGILAVLGLFIVIFSVIKLANSAPSDKTSDQISQPVNVVSSSDWVKGSKDAKVTLVEYSDFQCPACGAYYPVVKQLNQEFGDKIQFVYRHFPLRQIHINAEFAARAAEAAGIQNNFWQMHDMLFEKQKNWSGEKNVGDIFIEYARLLNLDVERFKNDLDLKEIKDRIEDSYQSGIRFRVNATPTFFLNDKKLQNPKSYEEFKKIIEEAILKVQ
ncbi:MAG: thioredoxin domain-containing protein [Candidatus Daviesbacteria bacterium]|nr:thioredoxin domain-containing protein [Candidatus Daviesbacteria bacterium]